MQLVLMWPYIAFAVTALAHVQAQKIMSMETSNLTLDDATLLDSSENKKELIEMLIKRSSRFVSPAVSGDKRVVVQTTIVLLNTDFSDANEELSIDLWLYLQWFDPRLKWDTVMYSGVNEVHLGVDMVWTPDTIFINNLHSGFPESIRGRFVTVQANGKISLVSFHPTRVACQLDASDFPRDKLNCHLLLSPWTSVGGSIRLKSKVPAIRRNYVNDSKWELIHVEMMNDENSTSSEPDAIHYVVRMQRHAKSYRLLFVVPAAMLGAIMPVVLLLPPYANSRPVISVLVMLGMLWMTESLHERIPSQGSVISHLTKYYISLMALALVSGFIATISDLLWWSLQVSAQVAEAELNIPERVTAKSEKLSWLAKLCFPLRLQRAHAEDSILLNVLSEANINCAGRRPRLFNPQAQRDDSSHAQAQMVMEENCRPMTSVDQAAEMSISKADSYCVASNARLTRPAFSAAGQSFRRSCAPAVSFKDRALQLQNRRVAMLRLFDRISCTACFLVYAILTIAYTA